MPFWLGIFRISPTVTLCTPLPSTRFIEEIVSMSIPSFVAMPLIVSPVCAR